MDALIEAVKQHALAHYNDGKGWDYVVECYDDVTLADIIGRASTPKGAIRKVGEYISPRAAFAEDIRAEEW